MIALLTSAAVKWGALFGVIATFLAVAWRAAFKAGKNSEIAKDAKANEQTISDIARANAARAHANDGKLSDSDGFKRD